MEYHFIEKVKGTATDELIIGPSSWDPSVTAVKYSWLDKRGRRCRGGEFPLSVFPQMFEMLIREGHIHVSPVEVLVNGQTPSHTY